MNASNRLDEYLQAFRSRLRQLTLLQGTAATALVLLVLSLVGAWFSAESGFATRTTNIFRVILVLGLAAAVIRYLLEPLRRLARNIGQAVESRTPRFDGRIATYTQMKESNNPFIDLLAEDTLRISAEHPVEQQVPVKELRIAGAALAVAALVFLYLVIAGPGLLNYSMRNLLAGWAFDGLLPPQSIAVTPGDESVRRGANVRITSRMEGFEPDGATIHIQTGNGQWQDVAMVANPLGFEFTFFSMQQDMNYYISSNGMRSPEYDISVLDVPGIESLSLTYHYPEWTERDPDTLTNGDVRTLPDTRVALTVTTTAPLPGGELVLNGEAQTLTLNGNQGSTDFMVLEEGEYYIAAIVGGEHVRLSDDYFIRLAEDGKPEIELSRPGGDYNASSIEEVLTRVEARDDYGLTNVALKYSVNGGDVQTVNLSEEHSRDISAEHLFMLEDMRTQATREVSTNVGQFNVVLLDEENPIAAQGSGANAPSPEPAPEQIPLVPGDIISYYAEASDRSQTVRTDMFFIQVQPYNRRYSQSQLSGGGGGGQQGGPQDEISQRQRQIIVSTWNLIREQAEENEDGQIDINSKLLSELQTTLAEQASTLAERTRARQLANDPQIEEFVNNMEQAVQRMHPASEQLASVNLDQAIQPAQEALQYLLRAESVFNDLTLTQQQGGSGGGGGRASQDLAEMFELEMDLELNQYETGNRASAQSPQQQSEDIMKQLDELARRQEQLASTLRNQQQLTEAQRYQQEMLRRQAEELQEQMQQLQRQQASNQPSQQGQQQAGNQQGQSGQQGQAGTQGGSEGSQQQAAGEQVAQSELERRMESAIRAMDQTTEAMQGNTSPEEMQRAAEEALRQLQEARSQVALNQRAGMQQSFTNMAELSREMLEAQQRMQRQLQEAMQKAIAERESGEDPNSRGMSLQDEWALAEEKRQLSAQLQQLQQAMMEAQQNFNRQVPDATDELQRANNGLAESEIEQAIAEAALYIDAGYGLYIANNESTVTAGIRALQERLERAEDLVASTSTAGDSELDRARRQAQNLRNQLQQIAQGGQPGEQQGQGQASEQQNQQGQPGQQEQQQQGDQPGGNQTGGNINGGRFANNTSPGGAWNGADSVFDGPIELPENFYDNVTNFTQLARNAVNQLDLNPEELARMYDMIRELEYSQVNRNDGILAQEYGQMLALLEQLEVGLQIDRNGNNPNNVRTANGEVIPEQYKDSVAEYFRRLSRE